MVRQSLPMVLSAVAIVCRNYAHASVVALQLQDGVRVPTFVVVRHHSWLWEPETSKGSSGANLVNTDKVEGRSAIKLNLPDMHFGDWIGLVGVRDHVRASRVRATDASLLGLALAAGWPLSH